MSSTDINGLNRFKFFKANTLASTVTIVGKLCHAYMDVSTVLFTLPICRTLPADDQWEGKIGCCRFNDTLRAGIDHLDKSFDNTINLILYLSKERKVNVKFSYNQDTCDIVIQISGAKDPENDGTKSFELLMNHVESIHDIIGEMRDNHAQHIATCPNSGVDSKVYSLLKQLIQTGHVSPEYRQYLYANYPQSWIDLLLEPLIDIDWQKYCTYLYALSNFPIILNGEFDDLKLSVSMANFNHRIIGVDYIDLDRIATVLQSLQNKYPSFYINYDNTNDVQIIIQYILTDELDFCRRRTPVVIFKIKTTGTISQTPYYANKKSNDYILNQLGDLIDEVFQKIL